MSNDVLYTNGYSTGGAAPHLLRHDCAVWCVALNRDGRAMAIIDCNRGPGVGVLQR